MNTINATSNDTVVFDNPTGPKASLLRPRWQVEIQADGSLLICNIGRRNGRILVEPSANNYITVTTDKIVTKEI